MEENRVYQQLDRIETKLDGMDTRVSAVEKWKNEIEGGITTIRTGWKVLAAVAGIAGFLIAHWWK